jgi:hypothetical protein
MTTTTSPEVMRGLVSGRTDYIRNARGLPCPCCDQIITNRHRNLVVDHYRPYFSQLRIIFLDARGNRPDPGVDREVWDAAWRRFHNDNAQLNLLHTKCHVTKTTVDAARLHEDRMYGLTDRDIRELTLYSKEC